MRKMVNGICERIPSVHGTHALVYRVDMSWLLRSVRLVLH